ncbi:hypothetical protein ACFLV7_16280, partial [Chloroflexota bacterium]
VMSNLGLFLTDSDSGTDNSSGKEFIEWLQSTDLFLIPLDERGQWFRFHHLIQERLQDMLKSQMGQAQINALHARASAWFANHSLIDEALQHAITAKNISFAENLVEQHRYDMMNTEQWLRLDRWLQMLPTESVKNNPKLLITQAWSGLMFHSQYNKWVNTPDQVEDLLLRISTELDEKRMITAESTLCVLPCCILWVRWTVR